MDGKRSAQVDNLSKLTKIDELKNKLVPLFDVEPIRQRLFYRGKQVRPCNISPKFSFLSTDSPQPCGRDSCHMYVQYTLIISSLLMSYVSCLNNGLPRPVPKALMLALAPRRLLDFTNPEYGVQSAARLTESRLKAHPKRNYCSKDELTKTVYKIYSANEYDVLFVCCMCM
jgi:hypothetical protein